VNRKNHSNNNFLNKLTDMVKLNQIDISQGTDYLLHIILDYFVDEKIYTIDNIQDELDILEEKIINNKAAFIPDELMRMRRNLLSVRKSINHEREILMKVCRKDSPFISDKAVYHFRDIYDHLNKYYEVIEMYREMISNFMEMYLSMMNNRMAAIANRTNLVVRRLTLITTIFMPLTLIAGIGGMSEWSMMTGPENWKIAYPLFLLFMIIIGIISYLFLKKIEKFEK